MTDVTRKLAAILAADVAGYQVPAMLAMGHERRKRHPVGSSGVGGRAGLKGAKADIAARMSLAGGTAEVDPVRRDFRL